MVLIRKFSSNYIHNTQFVIISICIHLNSAPGKVRDILVQPEIDVTKPRTVRISWQSPNIQDLHGKINGYTVTYSTKNVRILYRPNLSLYAFCVQLYTNRTFELR